VEHTIVTKKGNELNVRRLGQGDGPALQSFNTDLSPEIRSRFSPHAYDDESVAMIVLRSEQDIDRTYAAWDGDLIVGYFFLWNFDQRVPLLGIGLADAYQGQSLGPQMMKRLIDDARAAGREGIELTTLPTNEAALKLYRLMGFDHLGDVENITGDGRRVIERLMFLPLKEGAQPSGHDPKPPV
jgi:ribosomal protein S18 acetylase RimI-like enzyme